MNAKHDPAEPKKESTAAKVLHKLEDATGGRGDLAPAGDQLKSNEEQVVSHHQTEGH